MLGMQQMLDVAGVAALTVDSPLDIVEAAVEQLAALMAEASPVRRTMLRAEGAAVLKQIGIRAPGAVIDAAESALKAKVEAADLSAETFGDGIVDIVSTADGPAYLVVGPEGPAVVEAWHGQKPWPLHRLPWPTVPDGAEVMQAISGQGNPPIEEHQRMILSRVKLPRPVETWALVLATWAAATYLADRFDHFPLIALEGPPVRGKTRLAQALLYPAFRGFLSPSLTPATLIRDRAWHRAAIAVDVENLPRKLLQGGDLGDLVLSSFQQDESLVRRVARPDAAPAEQIASYRAYGPTVLVTNEPIPEGSPLASRCIPLRMPEAGDIATAAPLKSKEAGKLRTLYTAWAAAFLTSGAQLPEVDPPFRGRVRDWSIPILRIVTAWAPQRIEEVTELFRALDEERREQTGVTPEARVALALGECRGKAAGGRVYVTDLHREANRGLKKSDPDWLTAQQVGIARRSLGLAGGHGGSAGRAFVRWPGDRQVQALHDRYRSPADR